MTDFLDTQRQQIASRLAVLAPQVQEYQRLEAAVEALDTIPVSSNGASVTKLRPNRRRGPGRPRGSKSAASPAAPALASTAKSAAKRGTKQPAGKPGGRRKRTGKRAAQALTHIKEAPGITIPELAKRLGTHPTYLYKVLPTLEEVVKDGRGWRAKATTSTGA